MAEDTFILQLVSNETAEASDPNTQTTSDGKVNLGFTDLGELKNVGYGSQEILAGATATIYENIDNTHRLAHGFDGLGTTDGVFILSINGVKRSFGSVNALQPAVDRMFKKGVPALPGQSIKLEAKSESTVTGTFEGTAHIEETN